MSPTVSHCLPLAATRLSLLPNPHPQAIPGRRLPPPFPEMGTRGRGGDVGGGGRLHGRVRECADRLDGERLRTRPSLAGRAREPRARACVGSRVGSALGLNRACCAAASYLISILYHHQRKRKPPHHALHSFYSLSFSPGSNELD